MSHYLCYKYVIAYSMCNILRVFMEYPIHQTLEKVLYLFNLL